MEWLLIAAGLAAAFSTGLMLRSHGDTVKSQPWHGRQGRPPDDPNSLPDNERFKTWDEAFNRRIKDELEFSIEYIDRDSVITK